MRKEIEKLEINLFPEELTGESIYLQKRAKYIADYKVYVDSTREYHSGGLFSSGYWTGEYSHESNDPVKGEAEWNRIYPEGYAGWRSIQQSLNAIGEQKLIDKLNEVIAAVNELKANQDPHAQ